LASGLNAAQAAIHRKSRSAAGKFHDENLKIPATSSLGLSETWPVPIDPEAMRGSSE